MTDDPGGWDPPDHDGADDAYGGGEHLGEYGDGYDGAGDAGLGPADPLFEDHGGLGHADDGTDPGDGADRDATNAGHDAGAGDDEPLDPATDHVPGLDGLDGDGHDVGDVEGDSEGEDGASHAGSGHTPDTDAGAGPSDGETFGADPDADPDAAWPDPEFPAALDLGTPPQPVDGFPWTDPSTLGDAAGLLDAIDGDGTTAQGAPDPADLAGYAGLDPDVTDWSALAASDDPATAALARFWAPPAG